MQRMGRRRVINAWINIREMTCMVVVPTIIGWIDMGLRKVHNARVWLQRGTRRSWGLRQGQMSTKVEVTDCIS
jgi:hypothetical protein